MNLKESLKLVGGSIVVYVAMAACSAASSQGWGSGDDAGPDDGATAGDVPGSSSGEVGASSGSEGPSILDVLTDPVKAASADQSGTRLKVKYYAGADGSKQSSGLHDSQLNVDCYFATASDGSTRCMPVAAVTLGSFFSDSGCSQVIGYTTSSCGTTPQYAGQSVSTGSNCGGNALHVYSVSGSFTGTPYYGSPSTCTAVTNVGDASALSQAYATGFAAYQFYTVGAELPPSTFVQGTMQTEP